MLPCLALPTPYPLGCVPICKQVCLVTYMLTSLPPTYLRAYQITTLPIHLATSGAIIGDLIMYTRHQRACAQVSV